MIRNHVVLYLVGFFASFVAVTVARKAIVHGCTAKDNEFPYQVALLIANQAPNCGGGIIGDHFIITAANCVIQGEGHGHVIAKPIYVFAGTNDLNKRGIVIEVIQVIVPQEYRPLVASSTGDIAVLKLKEPLGLKENSRLMQLKLPSHRRQFHEDAEALIAGFGWSWIEVDGHKQIGGRNDTYLRYADAVIISNKQCAENHPTLNITNKQLCAGLRQYDTRKPRGVCVGDGGSPLVYKGKTVVGVFSVAKVGCSEVGSSAVYTRVSQFLYFIDNAMKNKKTDFIRFLNV